MDYLTVTVPCEPTAEHLAAITEGFEAGKPVAGFQSSERRICLGGFVWRRWAPRQRSKAYGASYESWDVSGPASELLADAIGPLPSRPTRIDLAYDFVVPPSIRADVLAEVIAELRPRAKHGITGQDGINTHYFGARASDRRIRIYRKDLQHVSKFAYECDEPPVLRIELTLKDREARAIWSIRDDREAMLRAGASHVAELTGLQVLPELGEIPRIERDPTDDPTQLILEFVRQNASMVALCNEAGVDLGVAAECVIAKQAKQTRSVAMRRSRALEAAGSTRVRERVYLALADELLCPVQGRRGHAPRGPGQHDS